MTQGSIVELANSLFDLQVNGPTGVLIITLTIALWLLILFAVSRRKRRKRDAKAAAYRRYTGIWE